LQSSEVIHIASGEPHADSLAHHAVDNRVLHEGDFIVLLLLADED